MANSRVNGGVKLHFSVNFNHGMVVSELVKDFTPKVDGRVFAATTISREGKQGDAWFVGENVAGGSVSLFDDFYHLRNGGMFAGGHVGEEVGFWCSARICHW